MDHQYGFIYSEEFKGWDWMCVHLDSGVDLMFSQVSLFRWKVLRSPPVRSCIRTGGPCSSSKKEFTLKPLRYWKSWLPG